MEPVNGGALHESGEPTGTNAKGTAHGRQTQHHLQKRSEGSKTVTQADKHKQVRYKCAPSYLNTSYLAQRTQNNTTQLAASCGPTSSSLACGHRQPHSQLAGADGDTTRGPGAKTRWMAYMCTETRMSFLLTPPVCLALFNIFNNTSQQLWFYLCGSKNIEYLRLPHSFLVGHIGYEGTFKISKSSSTTLIGFVFPSCISHFVCPPPQQQTDNSSQEFQDNKMHNRLAVLKQLNI